MKKIALSAFVASALVLAAGVAHADDGKIQFNGELVAGTCEPDVEGQGPNGVVNFPAVQTSQLTGAAGKITAGDTNYKVSLKNCTPVSGYSKAAVFYQAGPTVDPADGRLIVDAGGAENVKIELLNKDGSQIVAGAQMSSQNSQPADISSGSATLYYIARYYATAQTTAGVANSSVTYSIAYE